MAASKRPQRKAGGGAAITLDGVPELLEALSRVSEGTRRRVLRAGMREGMDVVTAHAQDFCPVRTGKLRKSIKTSVRKPRNPWRVRVETRAGQGHYKGKTFYGAFVEFGTKFARPHPFMAPALDAGGPEAVRVARAAILEGVEEEAAAAAFRRTTIGRYVTRARKVQARVGKARRKLDRRGARVTKRLRKVSRKLDRSASKAARRASKATSRTAKNLSRSAARASKRASKARKAAAKATASYRKATTKAATRYRKAAAKTAKTYRKAAARTIKAARKRVAKAFRPARRRRR